MTATAQIEQQMAARYGGDRNPWPGRMVVGGLLLAVVATAAWAGVGVTRGQIEGNLLNWTATDHSATLQLEVRGTSEGSVTCAVKALDGRSTDIGYREFTLPSSPMTTTVGLPTLFTPAAVTVLGCARTGEPLRVPPPDFPPGVAIP